MSNPTLSITRFVSATSKAAPEDTLKAPLDRPHDGYNMLDVINTWIEHQEQSGRKDYFSFSRWDGGHNSSAYEESTCLVVEYEEKKVPAVRAAIHEMGLGYFMIPTQSGRTKCRAFVFPLDMPLEYNASIRSTSFIIEAVAKGGVTKSSYLPTWFMRLRPGLEAEWTDGNCWDDEMLAKINREKVITHAARWER